MKLKNFKNTVKRHVVHGKKEEKEKKKKNCIEL